MTVDNAGIFTTGPAADLTVGNLAQISTAGTGTNTIGNDITGMFGAIDFATAVTLDQNAANTITFSTVAGGGNINLGSTLNNATGESIAFIAGTGNVDVTGAVTLGAGNITVTSATNVDFRNTVSATDFTQADGTGTTTFAGTITLADAFDFTGNNLTINGTGNNVTGAMTVDNAGIFTTATGADLSVVGGFTQNGAGVNVLGGNIRSTGANTDISFLTGVTLTNDVAMSTDNGTGNILFSSIVDGTTAGTEDLTLTAGGNITMTGLVGDGTPLGAILINSAADVTTNGVRAASFTQTTGSGLTTINAGDFTTGLDQGIGATAAVAINNDTIAVNGSINAGTTVTLNAETAGVTIVAAGDITAGGAVNITGATGISTAGDVTTTGGVVNYNSATTLTGPIQVNAGAGNITFENILDGNFALTLASSGDERFNGAVGSMDALASIQTDAPGRVIFNGGLVKTIGAQEYLDAAILGVNTTLEGNTITLASTVNGAHSLTITDLGQTTLGGEIGGVTPLVNLTVDTAGGLVLPKTTLSSNMSLTTEGAVTQVGALYVGGTTHIDAGANPITLTNGANDFVGVVGSLDGTSVGVKGTVVSITDSNNINLGQIAATDGAVTINAGGSIYNGLAGVTNITSTAASMLGGNGGVVGTLYNPVTVNVPSITANATQQQSGVSIDLSGHVGDNTIWLTQTPPGLVILNGMILNPGQIPGVPQNAYATALAVLDQTYLTGNGNVLNTKPYSTVGTLNGALYPTDDNDKAFSYGPYIYKLPRNVKVKDGGVKLPAGVQLISMNK